MKKLKNKNLSAGRQGFTLIELMVAMAIFAVVITVVLGVFSMAIRAQKRVITLQNIQESAKFIIEFMAKEIRMSTIKIDSTSSVLSITRFEGGESDSQYNVTYTFNNSAGTLNRQSPQSNNQLNPAEVKITGSFDVVGVGADNFQPKVTILMKLEGVGYFSEEKAVVNIQTTLSQRILDIVD